LARVCAISGIPMEGIHGFRGGNAAAQGRGHGGGDRAMAGSAANDHFADGILATYAT